MNIGNIPIMEFGNTVLLCGAVFSDQKNNKTAILLPGVEDTGWNKPVPLSVEDWTELIRQTDLKLVEITHGEKRERAIVRKCERSIDKRVSWAVFKRDNYACRYCGNDDTPLTVDHLVLWENQGPSTEDNLLSCCSKCNKVRGNTDYYDWIVSKEYDQRSANLSSEVHLANTEIDLSNIKLRTTIRKR